MPAETDQETVADHLVEILRHQVLDEHGYPLAQDQVRIYNEAGPIREDNRIYIVVAFLRNKIYSLSKRHVSKAAIPPSNLGTLTEVQHQAAQETHRVTLFSSGRRAQYYKNQITFALRSDDAEASQEINGFRIGELPSDFVDTSAAEASRILNRYDLTFNVLTSYRRERDVAYYDTFVKPGLVINQ